jgi:hypothetical protein
MNRLLLILAPISILFALGCAALWGISGNTMYAAAERRRMGLCDKCGYGLSPERCPECGAEAAVVAR